MEGGRSRGTRWEMRWDGNSEGRERREEVKKKRVKERREEVGTGTYKIRGGDRGWKREGGLLPSPSLPLFHLCTDRQSFKMLHACMGYMPHVKRTVGFDLLSYSFVWHRKHQHQPMGM